MYALEHVEWEMFKLTLDGEPINAMLLLDEMKDDMELEWLWDARDLSAAKHTLDVTITYQKGAETRDLHATRVFDLSAASLGQSYDASYDSLSEDASKDTSKIHSSTHHMQSAEWRTPQRVRVNTPAQVWTMVTLRWLEPFGALLGTLAISFGTLLLLKQPRALLGVVPSSVGKRIQQLRSDPVLFSLFFNTAMSLAGGTYFCGMHDRSFVVSLLWVTLTYSRDYGWNSFFWSEIAMWGLATSLCVLLPMLAYCLFHLQPLRCRFGRWVEYGCLFIAIVYTLIQTVLIVGNFSPSLWFFSWNTFWLPPLLIAGTLLACRRKSVGGENHVV